LKSFEDYGKLCEKFKDVNLVNVPLLKKGDFVLTESLAILQYICLDNNRIELLGKTAE